MRQNFINDQDGVSSKDYLLLISTFVFFVFIVIGLIMLLAGKKLDGMYLSLLDMVTPVVMTVVGGVCGVQAVEVFTNRNQTKTHANGMMQQQQQQGFSTHPNGFQNPQQFQQPYQQNMNNFNNPMG